MNTSAGKRSVEDSIRDARIAAYQTAILDAAERVFTDAGFELAKMEDIARAAGVAKGTLYNYFPSKEAIFSALAERGRSRLLEAVDPAIARAPVEARPRAFVQGLLEYIEQGARMALVYMHATGLSMNSALDPSAPEGRQSLTARLRESLRPSYEAGRLRTDLSLDCLTVLLGGMIGAAVQDFLERGEQSGLTDMTDSILAVFFDGAGAR